MTVTLLILHDIRIVRIMNCSSEFTDGILLPLHHRQKVSHGGTLSIQSVQRAADEGEYSCVVRSMDGETATGTTFVSVVGMFQKCFCYHLFYVIFTFQ
ncbi:hypothetical protein AVEN_215061-1 [Araneus ventricosus]|uniref:Ig-like domain-containing protein n=2 Tax=Araneus ventricosus TaxID=182803 RepID=A0A4Y2IYS6_ARAVE|nr:hypothetical protein AVEN_68605-1 [Araneus ventricosus]GBM83006.1 hypothetical protein AVEN_215061-1 [Araneus ventricosus]